MTNPTPTFGFPPDSDAAEALGRFVAARLSEAEADIDRDWAERLRAAREQAVARRKLALVPKHLPIAATIPSSDLAMAGTGSGSWSSPEGLGLWTRLASLLPLLALVAGLWTIHVIQNQHRAAELADVDAALLTDDLPPSAYADPGFLEFLHAGAATGSSASSAPPKD